MGTIQFDAWLASEIAHEQEQLHDDLGYLAWLEQQARQLEEEHDGQDAA